MTTAAMINSIAIPLTDQERTTLGGMSSDLRFILSESSVPEKWQLLLMEQGYSTMTTFGVIADDRAGVRAALIADLHLNAAEANLSAEASTKVRLITTQVLAAWIAVSQRVTDEIRISSDHRMLRLPNMLTRTSVISLRQRYETDHGRVSDSIWPCVGLLERRLEEVEEGVFTAQLLSEIISVEQSTDEQVVIHEAGVNLRVRKAAKSIAMPVTTEDLRNRMKTLAITFIVAAYRHGSRLWLRTANMEVFNLYTEYLLSDQCAMYHLDEQGISVKATWATVLSYELQMRKLVCRAVLYDQKDFGTALREAQEDMACRTRYFITPTAILASASKNSRPPATPPPGGTPPPVPGTPGSKKRKLLERKQLFEARKASKAEAKAAGTPKGKGKGKGQGKRDRVRTPDGRLVCGFWNEPGGCSKEDCTWVHVCSKCFADHPRHQCTVP